MLHDALRYQEQAFAGLCRKYHTHVPKARHAERVMIRLMKLDDPDVTDSVLTAAVLHDTLEDDVGTTMYRLISEFNSTVAKYVHEVTNPSKGSKAPRAERKRMDREHLAQVSRGARLIKLADRIDNINDMYGAPEDFKLLYAHESRLLLEVLSGTCEELESELTEAIERLEDGCKN